jgi:hypothetical protein
MPCLSVLVSRVSSLPSKPEGPRSDSRCRRMGLTGFALRGVQTPHSGIGPILLATNSRPGPASIHSARLVQLPVDSHRRLAAARFAATARPTGRLGGFPTGRPWDFATEASPSAAMITSPGGRCHHCGPESVPRIAGSLRNPLPDCYDRWTRSAFWSRDSLPRDGRSLAATLTQIA